MTDKRQAGALTDAEISAKHFPELTLKINGIDWVKLQSACVAAIAEARRQDAERHLEVVRCHVEWRQAAEERIGELERAIVSWKAEELVWRQSDQEHRIKAQQMQAGAESLIEELAHEKARHNIGGDIFEAERNRMILNQTTELKYLERAEAAESRADALTTKLAGVRETLRRIERWFGEFPEAIDREGRKVSYGSAYGSNGERDFMRALARAVLSTLEETKIPIDKPQNAE